MEKRSTTSAMLFSVGLVFMLVCAVGSFFYGVHIGSAKVETKYKNQMEAQAAEENGFASPYQQQDLVSFYHTVYLPYREFQNEWFATLNKVAQGQTVDAASMFKHLAKLAESKSKEASSIDMQKSSLLGQAQINYIRSLQLFHDAANNAAANAKSTNLIELKKQIEQEKNYKSAAKEALSAQQAYYLAIQKWASSIDLEIADDYDAPANLALEQWSSLPLTVKNKVIADQLLSFEKLNSYYPHDMTSRIDEFIQTGQADNMNLKTLTAVVELLLNTNAVRSGDFLLNKQSLYVDELLPQLPFFYPEAN